LLCAISDQTSQVLLHQLIDERTEKRHFRGKPNNIDQSVSVQVACGIMDDDDAGKITLGEPEGISMSRI
jgi:hypothetical protein